MFRVGKKERLFVSRRPAPSKRAQIRQLLSESTLNCVVAFDHWQVRDAVATLAYLGGPRSPDDLGDRWLVEKRKDLGGRGAARARRCAGLFLGGITGLAPERILAFFGSELCAVESLRAVDAHTCVATFVLEHGARCLRHQAQHLLFTADSKLCAFEVLEFSTQARRDL